MKNFFIISIVFLFIEKTLYSQDFSHEDILKFKIKSVTTADSAKKVYTIHYFNEDGNLIMSGIKEADYIAFTKQLVYDDHKHITEERLFTPKLEPNGVIRYYYNAEHQLTKKEAFNADDVLDFVWTYEYDATGKKIKETCKLANNEKMFTKYKYVNDNVIEEEISNSKKVVQKSTNFIYNDKNQLTAKKTLDYSTKAVTGISYIYDEFGRPIRIEEISTDGVSSSTQYIYNDKGILERLEKKNYSGEEFKLYYQVEFFQ